MNWKTFNHPDYKTFAGIFEVSRTGRVRRKKDEQELTQHFDPRMGQGNYWVSLYHKGNYLSIAVGRLVALTYLSQRKTGTKWARHKNDRNDDSLANLTWSPVKYQEVRILTFAAKKKAAQKLFDQGWLPVNIAAVMNISLQQLNKLLRYHKRKAA